MNTYQKIFADANAALIKKSNKKSIILFVLSRILIYCIIPALSLVGLWLIISHDRNISYIIIEESSSMWVIIIFVFLLVGALGRLLIEPFPSRQELCSKKLRKKALEFATTTYYDDLIAALDTKFTLTESFKKRFKDLLGNAYWLDYTDFSFDSDGIVLDYKTEENECFEIQYKDQQWYFNAWEYSPTQKFIFIFDVVNKDGEVRRKVELRISPK